MERYIIVGNGVAAINAVEAIRARGDRTPISLLTDQECAFYSRPSLYYVMLGRIEFADAWGRPEYFYEQNGVELRCGTTVTAVDVEAHRAHLDGGQSLDYSRLLLATGTRGRTLPWAERPVAGIITLNTLTDVVNTTELLSNSKGAVVVGGGLTSIELAEVCRRWGVPATFVMRGDRFFDVQLDAYEAELIHRRLRMGGVTIRTQEEISDIRAVNGRVAAAITGSGEEIPCDIAACTIGVTANKELAEAPGGETDRGIVVDDRMRTTLPDIYAAGDCCQVHDAEGRPRRSEMLWYVAAAMGRVAGANIAGGEEAYQRRVFLNVAEFCGLDFCGVGDIVPGQPGVEEVVVRDPGTEGSIRLVLRDGVLIGACFVGDIRLSDLARGLIATGARPRELAAGHPVRRLMERGSP